VDLTPERRLQARVIAGIKPPLPPSLPPSLQDAAAKEALDLTPERRLQAGVMTGELSDVLVSLAQVGREGERREGGGERGREGQTKMTEANAHLPSLPPSLLPSFSECCQQGRPSPSPLSMSSLISPPSLPPSLLPSFPPFQRVANKDDPRLLRLWTHVALYVIAHPPTHPPSLPPSLLPSLDRARPTRTTLAFFDSGRTLPSMSSRRREEEGGREGGREGRWPGSRQGWRRRCGRL